MTAPVQTVDMRRQERFHPLNRIMFSLGDFVKVTASIQPPIISPKRVTGRHEQASTLSRAQVDEGVATAIDLKSRECIAQQAKIGG